MDYEDFKKLSQEEAFIKAGEIAGVPPKVLDGLWRAESGRGKNMKSPAGAEGHFQLMPKTRELLEKKLGVPIDPYNFNSSLFAAAHHLRDDMVREKGDLTSALRAYNNGPNWRQKPDARGENAAYASRVLGDDAELLATPRNAKFALAAETETRVRNPMVLPTRLPEANAARTDAIFAADKEVQVAREAADAAWSFGDAAGKSLFHNGLVGAFVRAGTVGEFEPEPGFVPDAKEVQTLLDTRGWGDDESNILRNTKSRKEFERRLWQLNEQDQANREIAARGKGWAVAAGLVGGLPEGALTGMLFSAGLGRMGLGAAQAARAGNVGRAGGLTVLENVAGNVAAVGLEDAMGGRVGAEDYWLGGLLGAVVSPISVPGLKAEAAAGFKQREIARVVEEFRSREAALEADAVKNVGTDPAAVIKEMERLETVRTAARVAEAEGTVDPTRKFDTDVDKLVEEENAQMKAQAAETQATPDAEAIPVATVVEDPEVRGSLFEKYGAGTHEVDPSITGASLDAHQRPAFNAISSLVAQFLPGTTFVVRTTPYDVKANGRLRTARTTTTEFVVELNPRLNASESVMTGVHEVGHALEYRFLNTAPDEIRAGVEAAYSRFTTALREGRFEDAMAMRRRLTSGGNVEGKVPTNWSPEYVASKSEFLAEQFSKYIEEDALKGTGKAELPKGVVHMIKSFVQQMLDLFVSAGRKGMLGPEPELATFFDAIRQGRIDPEVSTQGWAPDTLGQAQVDAPAATAATPNLAFLSDPVAIKYGLDKMPVDTPQRRAEAKAVLALYKKADDPKAIWNNLDPQDLDRWFKSDAFDAVKSTSLRMLQSQNPIMRMVAAELLESPSGAAGRRSTAAIKKFMHERKFMGRAQLDFDAAYMEYRNVVGGSVVDDHLNQQHLRQFNRLVAEELESRNAGKAAASERPLPVIKAANVLEEAYERMRVAQQSTKTLGWAGLPETSKGYMPHRMSAEAIRNMTRGQENTLYNALVDQFVNIEGWDMSFSDKLAAKYIDRVRQRALGGYDSRMGVTQTGAADIIEDAMKAMGMSADEVRENMQRYMRGAAGHTKRRIRLDLNQEHVDPDTGATFRLMDFFETDQMNLLRQQAQRVSGEVALTEYGVTGRPGMLLIRRAAEFGYEGGRVAGNADEIDAFDQVMAEFLGDPVGNHQSRNLDRVMMFTTLSRLGGVVWNQVAETIQIATQLGIGHAFRAIADMPRMVSEVRALVKGDKVDGILSGIETWGYAPGLDHYRMNFPYESHTGQNTVLGRDSMNAADRLLRSGLNLQAKLTGWRLMTAVQERAASEQIVLKALKYIRDGGDDVALRDMGFTPDVVAQIKAELPYITTQDASGKFTSFDIQKMTNKVAAEDFVQAVHRGAKQIIQGTYIGETGKYAHDGWLKLLTQFKTFSLVAVEKQWGRNVTNHGMVKSLAILLASMSVAAPIYMARVAFQAQGRPDKEKYLEERLRPEMIARATLNYVASSGMAGELMDALSSVSGVGQVTGGRAGAETGFVGSVVAPAAGVVDDVWKSVQNSRDGTNVHAVAKNLPFANAPFLVPVMNTLRPDE